MAPIRRYLRITKYSILEVRIYPEKPSDTSWLLSAAVLPRVIAEIRPKVLPKLREENENAKKKGGKKKKGIRDVAGQEDFEVVMFLTETSGRHSLITKKKEFGGGKARIKSTGGKLTRWLNNRENPIAVEDDGVHVVLREEVEHEVALKEIPEAGKAYGKRKAVNGEGEGEWNESFFVGSSDDEDGFHELRAPASKRRRRGERGVGQDHDKEDEDLDDKKKLALNTSYDGFSIYGRILCLIVKRKGRKTPAMTNAPVAGGSQMMEHWVSTQAAARETGLDDDD